MNKVLVIGAGAIGKGVITPLMLQHHMDVTLANRTKEKILNPATKSYLLYCDGSYFEYKNFQSCAIMDTTFIEALQSTDIIILTLQKEALPIIGEILATQIKERYEVDSEFHLTIILCSNSRNVKEQLQEIMDAHLNCSWLEAHLEILHALVFIGARLLDSSKYDVEINTQNASIEVESSKFSGISNWGEITEVKSVEDRLSIKLSLINRVQLFLALMGKAKGYQSLAECFHDDEMMRNAEASYKECYISLKSVYPDGVDRQFAKRLWQRVLSGGEEKLERFLQHVDDKLALDERILLPMQIAYRNNLPMQYMEKAYYLAIQYIKNTNEREVI